MIRAFESVIAMLGLIIALAAFGVGWRALEIADDQLRTSNQLTAVTLYFDQWQSLIEMCVAEESLSTDGTEAGVGQARFAALGAMLDAVAKVTSGDPRGAIEAFLVWRDDSGCDPARAFVPTLDTNAFVLDEATRSSLEALFLSSQALGDVRRPATSPPGSVLEAAIRSNLDALALEAGPLLRTEPGERSPGPRAIDEVTRADLEELMRTVERVPGLERTLVLPSSDP